MQEAVKADISNVGFILAVSPLTEELCPDIMFTLINSYDIYAVTAKYSKYVPANVKELTQAELAEIPQVMLNYQSTFNVADTLDADIPEYTYNVTFETDNNNIYYQAIINDVGIGKCACLMPISVLWRGKICALFRSKTACKCICIFYATKSLIKN